MVPSVGFWNSRNANRGNDIGGQDRIDDPSKVCKLRDNRLLIPRHALDLRVQSRDIP